MMRRPDESNKWDGTPHATVRFTTQLDERFRVPRNTMLLPMNITPKQLGEVINELLPMRAGQSGNKRGALRPFAFLVAGSTMPLTDSLGAYLEQHDLSGESTVSIEYIAAGWVPPPMPPPPLPPAEADAVVVEAAEAEAKHEAERREAAQELSEKLLSERLVGRHVVLHSLVKRPELNDLMGIVESFDESCMRCAVQLPGQRRPLLLRASNLAPMDDPVGKIVDNVPKDFADEVRRRVSAALGESEEGGEEGDEEGGEGGGGDGEASEPLELNGMGMGELSSSIGVLGGRLASLDVSANQLQTLPPTLGSLTRLAHLDVAGNAIRALPEVVGRLTALESLYAEDNRMRVLPASLGKLTALKELRLSDNELGETGRGGVGMPEGGRHPFDVLSGLRSLRSLALARNRLDASHVASIARGGMKELAELDLADNEIRAVPLCLVTNCGQTSPKLRASSLHLSGNPMQRPPMDVVAKGFPAMREWLEEHLGEVALGRMDVGGELVEPPPVITDPKVTTFTQAEVDAVGSWQNGWAGSRQTDPWAVGGWMDVE